MRYILVLLLLAKCVFVADAENKESVVVSVIPDRRELRPYEPLGVLVNLNNKSKEDVKRTATRWTSLRYKRAGDADWTDFSSCGVSLTPVPPHELTLAAGASNDDTFLLHVDAAEKAVFEEPGVYSIQAGTPFGESAVIKVTVIKSGIDKDVESGIREKRLYMLFERYASGVLLESADIGRTAEQVERLRNPLSNTTYAGWLNVADFALVSTKNKAGKAWSARQAKLTAEYRLKCSQLARPAKEMLLIMMASTAMECGMRDEAIEIMRQLKKSHEGGYFKVLAGYYLDSLWAE